MYRYICKRILCVIYSTCICDLGVYSYILRDNLLQCRLCVLVSFSTAFVNKKKKKEVKQFHIINIPNKHNKIRMIVLNIIQKGERIILKSFTPVWIHYVKNNLQDATILNEYSSKSLCLQDANILESPITS